ncbi:MAG TPA: hypothetical protein O0Y06_07645 [Methanocorpusculum sp.]|nr:hypothetical protein [Methanocorpusculum sp.]
MSTSPSGVLLMGGGNGTEPVYPKGLHGTPSPQTTLDQWTANDILEEIDKEIRTRDSETHMAHREEAKTAIDADIDGNVRLEYGGSVSKDTYVEGSSDVDCRVDVSGTSLEKKTPQDINKYFAKQIEANNPQVKSCSIGKLGVTVKYKDGTEMQYIPMLRTRNGYRLPNPKLPGRWSKVIYEERFKRDLRRTNKKCNGKLYAVIRLIKAQRESGSAISGYHIESLANRIFKHYPDSRPKTLPSMLEYYYKHASNHIRHRIRDRTGQSSFVDKEKLGPAQSSVRDRESRKMEKNRKILAQTERTGNTQKLADTFRRR